jgi:hypothetical protein
MARRVAIGNFLDGHAGIRVSKPGYDAMMNPVDDTKMMLNSDWASCLPIHWVSGFFTLGANASATLSFDDLGYPPLLAACWKLNSGGSWTPVTVFSSSMGHYSTGSGVFWLAIQAQGNSVYVASGNGAPAIDLSIVIFRVQAF